MWWQKTQYEMAVAAEPELQKRYESNVVERRKQNEAESVSRNERQAR